MFLIIIAVGLIVAGVAFIHWAESIGLPVNSSLFTPLWALFVLMGWSLFARGIWAGSWHTFTSPQTIVLKTEKTPFQIFVNTVNSCITQIIGGIVLIMVAMIGTEHGDLLMQILQTTLSKLVRIVQVLFE